MVCGANKGDINDRQKGKDRAIKDVLYNKKYPCGVCNLVVHLVYKLPFPSPTSLFHLETSVNFCTHKSPMLAAPYLPIHITGK